MLPRHDTSGWIRRTGEYVSLCLAGAGLCLSLSRWWCAALGPSWQTPVLFVCGVATADFLSGLLHWFADTWGSAAMPLLGRRVLHPFRVHHANPADILDRGFVDLNGDVALVTAPVLATTLWIPFDADWGAAAWQYLMSICTAGLFTNQIHQWAHSPTPPRLVRFLQTCRLILRPQMHCSHHDAPYDSHYCITTGWCNPVLEKLGFFVRLEHLITTLTGQQPRHDDRSFSTARSV